MSTAVSHATAKRHLFTNYCTNYKLTVSVIINPTPGTADVGCGAGVFLPSYNSGGRGDWFVAPIKGAAAADGRPGPRVNKGTAGGGGCRSRRVVDAGRGGWWKQAAAG